MTREESSSRSSQRNSEVPRDLAWVWGGLGLSPSEEDTWVGESVSVHTPPQPETQKLWK